MLLKRELAQNISQEFQIFQGLCKDMLLKIMTEIFLLNHPNNEDMQQPNSWENQIKSCIFDLNHLDTLELKFMDYTAQKMKFSIEDFFSKCDQIRRKLRIWSHLLKKSLIENFIFCAVLALSTLKFAKSLENYLYFVKLGNLKNVYG